jgi:hypothetical protein
MVDISDFLLEGENLIDVVQTSDASAYQFVLRGHPPTQAQLQQVAQRREKDRNWKDWLNKMSQPFDTPIPVHS